MTKEELEKEAEEYVSKYQGWGWTPHEGSAVYNAMLNSYIDSAEPREKRITELEAQIEKMKCCENCKHHYIALDDTTSCKLLDRLASSKPCDKWEIKENE